MSRHCVRLFVTGLAAMLATVGVAASGQSASGQDPAQPVLSAPAPKANPPVVFAQAQSDLQVDPDARFGQMPNGMTYVLYKNRTPPGTAAVWLRFAAGSIMEQEDQRGLAHFVEHMAFNGSKNVPEGEMVKLLQRHGLAFGADTNAHTTSHETLYTLNLPDVNDRIVDDALFLMRETASNISFDQAAIDRERGVVLGEERARGGSAMDAFEAQMQFMFPGQKYAERLPIGLVEVIKTAQRPAFMRFYNDFYRPEYATLIVVGDIDVDKVENKIRQRFADWQAGPQSPDGLTDYGRFNPPAKPAAKVFVGAGLSDAISVSWVAPPRDIIQTKAKDFDDLLLVLAKNILDVRFERAASSPDAAFIGAGVQSEDIDDTARIFSLAIRPKKDRDQDAFAQAMAIFREFLVNGPSEAELKRFLQHYDSYFQNRVAAARTIPTSAIAERIANAVRSRGVLQSPAQERAEFEELKPGFTPAAILAVLKQSRLDSAPYLWRQGAQKNAFDEAAMLAAYRAATTATPLSLTTQESRVWPYERFGKPSPVVSRRTLTNVGATRIAFANGVILTVKPTDLVDNDVTVSVQLGNGLAGIETDKAATLFAARQAGLSGGLGKLTADELRETLAGTVYGANFSIGGRATMLGGATTKADFARQMQVLAAFVTDPAFRPETLERFKATLEASYADMRTSPSGTYMLRAGAAVYGDDPRFMTPSEADLRAVKIADVEKLIRYQLDHGRIEITIVGDISVETAISQVGVTFGALPKRPNAHALPHSKWIRFPTDNLHRVYTHQGRADQNLSMIAWPTTDYFSDPKRAAGLQLLAAILAAREIEEVREKQGASYSATAGSSASPDFPGFGFIEARSLVRPETNDAYFEAVSAIVDDLKRKPVTYDELFRARQPMIDRLRNQQKSNGYWMAMLSGSNREARQITASLALLRHLEAVTSADIQRLARKYLVMDRSLRIQVKPASPDS